MNEIYSKPARQIYSANKTDLYCIDNIRSSDILGPKGYGLENIRNYRYVLVVIDKFSNFGCRAPLEKMPKQ